MAKGAAARQCWKLQAKLTGPPFQGYIEEAEQGQGVLPSAHSTPLLTNHVCPSQRMCEVLGRRHWPRAMWICRRGTRHWLRLLPSTLAGH